jgi:hypothetical protein
MRSFAAHCVDFRFTLAVLAFAVAADAGAQADSRDVIIEQLQRRIELLERRLEEKPAPPVAPTPPSVAKPAPPPPKPTASEQAGAEDEGGRALERTLVREGGLVLPPGGREVEPRLQYSYRSFQGLRIVTVGGVVQVAERDEKRDELEASLGVRYGLPNGLQAEARIPYLAISEDLTTGTDSERRSTSGPGDLELGLTKQLSRERAARPSLLASLLWRVPTGRHNLGQPSPGGGFHHLQAGVTAVKRQDPLVFFGTLSYTAVLERSREGAEVDPGDVVGMRFGGLLAASPETSLRAGFELSRARRTKVNDASLAGSESTIGMLQIGIATLLSSKTLFDLQLDVGLTNDAPDFRLRISLPTRF